MVCQQRCDKGPCTQYHDSQHTFQAIIFVSIKALQEVQGKCRLWSNTAWYSQVLRPGALYCISHGLSEALREQARNKWLLWIGMEGIQLTQIEGPQAAVNVVRIQLASGELLFLAPWHQNTNGCSNIGRITVCVSTTDINQCIGVLQQYWAQLRSSANGITT